MKMIKCQRTCHKRLIDFDQFRCDQWNIINWRQMDTFLEIVMDIYEFQLRQIDHDL